MLISMYGLLGLTLLVTVHLSTSALNLNAKIGLGGGIGIGLGGGGSLREKIRQHKELAVVSLAAYAALCGKIDTFSSILVSSINFNGSVQHRLQLRLQQG